MIHNKNDDVKFSSIPTYVVGDSVPHCTENLFTESQVKNAIKEDRIRRTIALNELKPLPTLRDIEHLIEHSCGIRLDKDVLVAIQSLVNFERYYAIQALNEKIEDVIGLVTALELIAQEERVYNVNNDQEEFTTKPKLDAVKANHIAKEALKKHREFIEQGGNASHNHITFECAGSGTKTERIVINSCDLVHDRYIKNDNAV